jgi:hypothetical protein
VVVVVGLTVIEVLVAPLSQRYVPPPLAVSVVLLPIQIELVPVTLAEGKALTVIN